MASSRTPEEQHKALDASLERAAQYLPAQTPLEFFVHYNILQAFQHLHFHDALAAVHESTGGSGYLQEGQYRDAYAKGRILESDLDACLDRFPAPSIDLPPHFPSARHMAKLVLLHEIAAESSASLRWLMAEREANTHFRPDVSRTAATRIATETAGWIRHELAKGNERVGRLLVGEEVPREALDRQFKTQLGCALEVDAVEALLVRHPERVGVSALWQACRRLVRHDHVAASVALPPKTGRPLPHAALVAVSENNPDELVHPMLIPLCGAFLDRGQSHLAMPDRGEGFFVAFRRIHTAGLAPVPTWLDALGERLARWEKQGTTAHQAVEELLTQLGIEDDERDRFIESTLVRLRGFAGMFYRLESAPAAGTRSPAKVRLVDFLAVRLTLDLYAMAEVAARLGLDDPLESLRGRLSKLPLISPPQPSGDHDLAWPLFQLVQLAGVSAPELGKLSHEQAASLVSFSQRFTPWQRRLVWHEAYERRHRERVLTALAANRHRRVHAPVPESVRPGPLVPSYQIAFCIDGREESVRRHLEELSSTTVTYGAAGFFGVAIAYQGIDDPSTFPLCPVVVTPQHRIEEHPHAGQQAVADERKRRRKHMGALEVLFARASRSLLFGTLVTTVAGFFAAVPLLLNVFAPAVAARLRKHAARKLFPEPRTRLTVSRDSNYPPGLTAAPPPAPGSKELFLGFDLEEKAARVSGLLHGIGLIKDFAPLVVIMGHNSSSVNNPHFAAYGCGACGGRSGGPNARLFARMANRPEVRAKLREAGLDIPEGTVFVGGLHDTATETITFYDLEELPGSHTEHAEALQEILGRALKLNAHERCRQFASAPRYPSPDEARRHVEERSIDLSQARPEYGGSTNAASVIGRRTLTKGVFLERRSFLVSYDATIDPSGAILERHLLAAGPVCSGINLQYYFSASDNEVFGAGTKLPHNVTGLFGVMNGASSDLRTGLPKQAVEIHECVRLQLIVEAKPEILEMIIARQQLIRELVHGEWVCLIVIDPDSGAIWVHHPIKGFQPWAPESLDVPVAARSVDWYAGKMEFASPALIGSSSPRATSLPPSESPLRAP